jgi:ATP-binding cassette subfamily B protein AbcA/BmrA
VREKLFDSCIRKDLTYFDETKTGDMISRIISDTLIIQEGLSTQIGMLIQMSTFAVVVIIIMFFYDVWTTFIAVVLVIPGALVAPFYTKINRELT